jgi:hypothetical protein
VSPEPQSQVLAPGQVIRGAFISTGGNAPGVPRVLGPFTPLRHPVAVASAGHEVYVADSGHARVFRIDPFANQLLELLARPIQLGTRLALPADLSLYVLDPLARRIERYAPEGRLLSAFAIDATIGNITDFALDRAHGTVIAVDSLHRRMVAYQPLGRAFQIVPLSAEPRHGLVSLDAIAMGPGALYAIDKRCACLVALAPDGRVLTTFGHKLVSQPDKIAADMQGRVFVYDRAERSLKIFSGQSLEESVPVSRYGLMEVTDLQAAAGWLYIADGPGAQIRLLRIKPKSQSRDEPAKL